jgi:hypothetical protein
LNRDGLACGVVFGGGEADGLLVLGEGLLVEVLGEGLLVVALGDALLVVLVGDALLVVVGDIVVVWAAAGALGCTSASQLRSAVKPAANTNTATTNINHLLRIPSVFYVKGFASRQLPRCISRCFEIISATEVLTLGNKEGRCPVGPQPAIRLLPLWEGATTRAVLRAA